ncbi:MAG: hypothetical protein ACI8RD_013708 [Bacillariaceae sp.]|jgi:hypothetical protein
MIMIMIMIMIYKSGEYSAISILILIFCSDDE